MRNPTKGNGLTPFFFTFEEVTKLTSLSRSTIDRIELEKLFPERIKISKRRVGWRSDEINDWQKGTWKGRKK